VTVRRRRVLWAVAVLVTFAAGALVFALAGDSDAVAIIAITLMGTAGVIAVSGAFYEVGRGEDDDRRRGRS
jgi:hypothetical protein